MEVIDVIMIRNWDNSQVIYYGSTGNLKAGGNKLREQLRYCCCHCGCCLLPESLCVCACACVYMQMCSFSLFVSAMTVIAGAHHYQYKHTYIKAWKMNWKKTMTVSRHLLSEEWLRLLLFPSGSNPPQRSLHPHGKRCSPCCKLTWTSWHGPISLT